MTYLKVSLEYDGKERPRSDGALFFAEMQDIDDFSSPNSHRKLPPL